MDDSKLSIFNAIMSFVQDLDTGFDKTHKPIALYNRLLEKTTLKDSVAIGKHITGFERFFNTYPNYLKNGTVEKDAKIIYSDRVFLDIGQILSTSDKEMNQHILRHLKYIYSIINKGTEAGKAVLKELKEETGTAADADIDLPNTTEGNFIKDTLTEMTEHFENIEDTGNPMAMMTGMMQSGFFQKFMGDLQGKMSSGEMDIKSLMSTVTSVISDVTPAGEADQLGDFLSQGISQVSALTGQQMTPEVEEHINQLTDAIGSKAKIAESPEDSPGESTTNDN